jgi:hypothetical protein
VRQDDVDREAVREDHDASGGRFFRDGCAERGKNAVPERCRIASQIADRIGEKARPGLSPFSAERLRGSVATRPAIGFRPKVNYFDRQAEVLCQRFGGLPRPPERACDNARDSLAPQ